MLGLSRANPRCSDSSGFTLVELMAAMLVAGVIIAAIVEIFVVSLHQQSLTSDKVQTDQRGRLLMTNIVDDLHSSCTGLGTSPIQAPSSKNAILGAPEEPALGQANATNLWFVSAYGNPEAGNAVIAKVTLHDLNWVQTSTSNTGLAMGTLTDYAFASSGGEAPKWTFPALKVANAKPRVLGTNIVAPSASGAPLFQYYSYNNNSAEAADGELNATPLSTPLTPETPETKTVAKKAGTAEETAKVTITLTQAPSDGDTRTGRTSTFTDSVILRFSPTTTGSEIVNGPCE